MSKPARGSRTKLHYCDLRQLFSLVGWTFYEKKWLWSRYLIEHWLIDCGIIALGLLHLGFKVGMTLVSAYKEMASVEKLVETCTEKHGQTAITFLCGRWGNPRVTRGQRSELVAGSWQADPRETLRGDRSVRCCGGQDEGRDQRKVTAPW